MCVITQRAASSECLQSALKAQRLIGSIICSHERQTNKKKSNMSMGTSAVVHKVIQLVLILCVSPGWFMSSGSESLFAALLTGVLSGSEESWWSSLFGLLMRMGRRSTWSRIQTVNSCTKIMLLDTDIGQQGFGWLICLILEIRNLGRRLTLHEYMYSCN